MEGDLITINKCLRPLSWFYGIGVKFRNMLFDTGILKSHAYSTPVISVGNITVGGTGKTPHVEYLIGLLKDKMNVAMLSRGYNGQDASRRIPHWPLERQDERSHAQSRLQAKD